MEYTNIQKQSRQNVNNESHSLIFCDYNTGCFLTQMIVDGRRKMVDRTNQSISCHGLRRPWNNTRIHTTLAV